MSYNLEVTSALPSWCYEKYDCLPKKYKLLQTPLLRSAREKGFKTVWWLFAQINEPSEDVWVVIQFLSAITLFGFSLGLVIRGHNTNCDYVRLSFSCAFLVYAFIDAVIRLSCRLAAYFRYIGSVDYKDPGVSDNNRDPTVSAKDENTGSLDDVKQTNIDDVIDTSELKSEVKETNIDDIVESPETDTLPKEERITQQAIDIDDPIRSPTNDHSHNNKVTAEEVMNSRNKIMLDQQSECQTMCLNTLSKIRYIAIDIFLYPMFICHVVKYSADRSHNVLDFNYRKYEGAFFLVFASVYLVLVYLTRLLVLGRSIWSVVLLFLPQDDNIEWKKALKHLCSHWCILPLLFLHTLFQFILQLLFFCQIWFIAENVFDMSKETTNVSIGLFYFFVIMGYFMPLLGIIFFFIPVYYHMEALFVNIAESRAELVKDDYYERLKKEHEGVTAGAKPCSCFFKLSYSYFSVPLFVLAAVYTVMLVVVISIGTSLFFSAESIPPGWTIYLVLFIAVSILSNIGVLFIGCFGVYVLFLALCAIVAILVIMVVFFWFILILIYIYKKESGSRRFI